MEFRILGPLEVRRDGQVVPLAGQRRRALLALLILRANEAVSFDALVEELWGADPPPTARAALQNQASALRSVLGADRLVTEGTAYRLRVEPHELDLDVFDTLVAEARGAEPEARARLLTRALSTWRGLPLVEFPAAPFAQGEVVRLEERYLAAVEQRVEAELENGHAEELVGELERLLARHPLRERLWAFLMLALYRSGRQAEALSTYRRAHRALVDELGVEPSRELKELQRRILLHDPVADARTRDPLLDAAALLPTGKRERAVSLLEYAHALRRLGDSAKALTALQEADRIAATLGDRVLLARAQLLRSNVELFDHGASLREHLGHARRAAKVFQAAGEDASLADALRLEGQLLRDLGHVNEATAAFERSLAAAITAGDRWQEGMSRSFLATCLAWGPTQVDTGIAACEEHLDAFEWEPPGPTGVWASLGELLGQTGQLEEGREHIRRGAESCRQMGIVGTLVYCIQALARLEFMAGNHDAAETHLREACDLLDSVGNRGGACLANAELAYLIGPRDPEEADRLTRASRHLAAEDDISVQISWRRARWRLEAADAGDALLDEAVDLCAQTDVLNLHALTLEDLAVAHRDAGNPESATAALQQAIALYEQKGNTLGTARVTHALA